MLVLSRREELTYVPSSTREDFSRHPQACQLLPHRSQSPPESQCSSAAHQKLSLKKKKEKETRAPSLGSAFVRCGVERTQRRQRQRPRALWFANVAVSILFAKKKRKSLLLTQSENLPRNRSWRSTGRRRRAPSTCRCLTCTRSLRTPQPAIRHVTGSHLI